MACGHPGQAGHAWQALDLAGDHLQETGNYRAIIDLIDAIECDRAPISSDRDARWALEMIHGRTHPKFLDSALFFQTLSVLIRSRNRISGH